MATAISAQAASWIPIGDSDDGTLRLLVDAESFTAVKSEENIPLIGAMYRYVAEGNPKTPVAYLTSVQACVDNGGRLVAREFRNNEWVTVANHWWSSYGPKMYDEVGKSLCYMLNQKLKQPKSDKPVKGNV